MMNLCVFARLHETETAKEAALYCDTIPNNPAYGRICLMQLPSGRWAVCVYRSGD